MEASGNVTGFAPALPSAGDLNPLPPSVSSGLYEAAVTAWKVASPFVIVLGTVGNALTIAVLSRSKVTWSDMSSYFLIMSVSDLLGLYISLTLKWLRHQFDIQVWTLHEAVCKITTWLHYGCSTMSTWTLVVMVTQRALSILWPHRVKVVCTRRSVRVMVTALVAFAMGINIHFLYFSTILELRVQNVTILKQCNEDYEDVVTSLVFLVFTWLHTLVMSCLPFIILVVDNVVLIRKVVRSTRIARMRLAAVSERQLAARRKKTSSMTLTLITASLAFLLLSFPYGASGVAQMFLNQQLRDDPDLLQLLAFAWTVCALLWCCNYAANFYLYFLTGSRFRAKTWEVLCFCKNAIAARVAYGGGDKTSAETLTTATGTEPQ